MIVSRIHSRNYQHPLNYVPRNVITLIKKIFFLLVLARYQIPIKFPIIHYEPCNFLLNNAPLCNGEKKSFC